MAGSAIVRFMHAKCEKLHSRVGGEGPVSQTRQVASGLSQPLRGKEK